MALLLAICMLGISGLARAEKSTDIADATFEELAQREVVSASRMARQISDSPSSLVGCAPVKWFTGALPFFERFGFHAAPALEAYLGAEMLGDAAAECLWRWNAERAASLFVQQGENISLEVRKNLFWHCPEEHFPKALEALSVEPALCDAEERKQWVRKYLPSSGPYAANALALLDFE